ncbi:MFS transporter [Lactobacillus sp. XV13L]|nr:MFS transporter [Lactobacillus sp. XV13L]
MLGFIASSVLASKIAITGLCALSTAAGVLAFLLALSLPVVEFQNNAGTDALKNLRRVFKNKTLITCGVLAFIQQGIQMATTMSFTTQIVREIGAPAYSEGLSSIIYMLAAVLFAKLTASKWIAQFTKRQILVASFILLAAYCFLVPLVGSIYLIYLLQVIPGVGTGILFAILNAEAISRVPQNVWSTATGVFQSIYALGMTSLPIFAGQLRAAYSLTTAFWVLGVLALVGGALAVKFWSD